jgi:hypothetical protein
MTKGSEIRSVSGKLDNGSIEKKIEMYGRISVYGMLAFKISK